MEIRREFMLRGVFPQQLPELQIGVEAVRFCNVEFKQYAHAGNSNSLVILTGPWF